MKISHTLAVVLTVVSVSSYAARSYDSYDTFYAEQPDALFDNSIKQTSNVVYSSANNEMHTELMSKINGKNIDLGEKSIAVNGGMYRYSNAVAFPGEYPSKINPASGDVYLALLPKGRREILCWQGDTIGAGEADRHKQVYLLTNPMGKDGKTEFLHLPSLFASCRAVLLTKDGKLAFPKNSYLFDKEHETRVGLLVSYYTLKGAHFVPIKRETRIQFDAPENPFRFSHDDQLD